MKRCGFTVVEVVIVITIMGILLTLGVVMLSSTQANARDDERRSDAESFATLLESYYRNASLPSTSSPGTFFGRTYPALDSVASLTALQTALPDLDPKIVRTPNNPGNTSFNVVAATNSLGAPLHVMPKPSASNDVFVYQPLRPGGYLCTTVTEAVRCENFNLFYYQETTGTVEMITSKNQ